jgi:hypothetical protein
MHREKKSSETPLRHRLAQLVVRALDQAKQLRPGPEREALIREARQAQIACQIDEWLSSPGLRTPE